MTTDSSAKSFDAAQLSIAPKAPHDDLTFEDLASRYNFRKTSERSLVVTRLILKECQRLAPPVRALDIGCGRGIERNVDLQLAIRGSVDEFWGLEPDPDIEIRAGLFDRCERSLMEEAQLPSDYFDVAYSFLVMEHVADPDAFMTAVWRCLKPGGAYFFVTPNQRHYFTRIASALHALHLDEAVLRLVRRGSVIDDYHYPVQYRFNDERRIKACAASIGFLPPEFAYLEQVGPKGYFPGPLSVVFHLLAAKRRVIQNPRSLITMVGRIRKPEAGDRPPSGRSQAMRG